MRSGSASLHSAVTGSCGWGAPRGRCRPLSTLRNYFKHHHDLKVQSPLGIRPVETTPGLLFLAILEPLGLQCGQGRNHSQSRPGGCGAVEADLQDTQSPVGSTRRENTAGVIAGDRLSLLTRLQPPKQARLPMWLQRMWCHEPCLNLTPKPPTPIRVEMLRKIVGVSFS